MREVDFVTQMIDEGKLIGSKRMFLHLVDAEDIIKDLSGPAKWNADWKRPLASTCSRPSSSFVWAAELVWINVTANPTAE